MYTDIHPTFEWSSHGSVTGGSPGSGGDRVARVFRLCSVGWCNWGPAPGTGGAVRALPPPRVDEWRCPSPPRLSTKDRGADGAARSARARPTPLTTSTGETSHRARRWLSVEPRLTTGAGTERGRRHLHHRAWGFKPGRGYRPPRAWNLTSPSPSPRPSSILELGGEETPVTRADYSSTPNASIVVQSRYHHRGPPSGGRQESRARLIW